MTPQQLALWEMMAVALRKMLPTVDAMADYEKTLNNGDRNCLELAESLRVVICLEEVFRPVEQIETVH